MKKEILIRKNNGEDTRFDPEKLLQSLIRSGAGQSEAKNVTEMIVPLVTDGMTTHQIYKLA